VRHSFAKGCPEESSGEQGESRQTLLDDKPVRSPHMPVASPFLLPQTEHPCNLESSRCIASTALFVPSCRPSTLSSCDGDSSPLLRRVTKSNSAGRFSVLCLFEESMLSYQELKTVSSSLY
jgi:hypothetical protein